MDDEFLKCDSCGHWDHSFNFERKYLEQSYPPLWLSAIECPECGEENNTTPITEQDLDDYENTKQ